uniref:Uncharacterized protein n=1 Tax=Solanum tuberosum TaxID=4113 RepID=M1DDA8_SOLTU
MASNIENMTLNDPLYPVNLNRLPEVKDDVEHQKNDNRRNNFPPTNMEDKMDQNNGQVGRLLGDYAKPNYNGMESSVRCPLIATKKFEIKHSSLVTPRKSEF